jgi:hypothetical protein
VYKEHLDVKFVSQGTERPLEIKRGKDMVKRKGKKKRMEDGVYSMEKADWIEFRRRDIYSSLLLNTLALSKSLTSQAFHSIICQMEISFR